jgi:ribosome-associated protein
LINWRNFINFKNNTSSKEKNLNRTKDLVFQVAKLAEDKKAEDTEILDITKIADIADFVIITSAQTPPQLKAIASHIEDSLTKLGMEPAHKEGKYGDKWFLLDYIDFVVHVIQTDAREFYNLEELWARAAFVSPAEWSDFH